jgi:hypothetical protein
MIEYIPLLCDNSVLIEYGQFKSENDHVRVWMRRYLKVEDISRFFTLLG